MALKRREFLNDLQKRIDEGRTFGRHPLWIRIREGQLPKAGLQTWAQQFFLQVREFPRAVSGMHSNCPFTEERIKLAESLYEEETGRISGCNLPHPELFIRFGEGIGLARKDMVDAKPFRGTAALIEWFESASQDHSFLEGAAAINLAAEGQVVGAFAPMARALEKHYGLTREQVAFWDIHEEADKDHSDVGDHIVGHHATTDEWQEKIRQALDTSLTRWREFFDDIQKNV